MNTMSFLLGGFVGTTLTIIAILAFFAWATHGDW